MDRSARAVRALTESDPEFRELVGLLYGDGVDADAVWGDVFKASPDSADITTPSQRKQRLARGAAMLGTAAGGVLGIREVAEQAPKAVKAIRAGNGWLKPVARTAGATAMLGGDVLATSVMGHDQKNAAPVGKADIPGLPSLRRLLRGATAATGSLVPASHPAAAEAVAQGAANASKDPKDIAAGIARQAGKHRPETVGAPGSGVPAPAPPTGSASIGAPAPGPNPGPGAAPAPHQAPPVGSAAPASSTSPPPAQPGSPVPSAAPAGAGDATVPLDQAEGGGGGFKLPTAHQAGQFAGNTVNAALGTGPRRAATLGGGSALYLAGRHRGRNQGMSAGPMYDGYAKRAEVEWQGTIAKTDDDKRLVFGWASVVKVNGVPVVDRQGDLIEPEDVEKAAYDYVLKSRKGGDMHRRVPIDMRDGTAHLHSPGDTDRPHHASDLVESFVVTDEKVAKMGLPADMPRGWWVGFKVHDPQVWDMVKKGERTGFSIHGKGKRVEKNLDEAMGYTR